MTKLVKKHVEDGAATCTDEHSGYPGLCEVGFEREAVIRDRTVPHGSVNLIVTSPPYADQRKNIYGGIHPDDYVDWFLPKAEQFKNALADDGSFVLNIKEKAVNGERHTYVLHLILALREQGWRWVEEYCWHKKNCYPGWWPNRFRDAWERCLHFTLSKKFKMRQKSVMVPMGDWSKARLKNLSDTDKTRDASKSGNGFAKKIENWVGRDMAYPSNVLHMATECGYKNHPATFPAALPDWFIRLFTDEGDTVLDPFAGSGTTLVAAQKLNRKGIGIDVNGEYCELIKQRINNDESPMVAERGTGNRPNPRGVYGQVERQVACPSD